MCQKILKIQTSVAMKVRVSVNSRISRASSMGRVSEVQHVAPHVAPVEAPEAPVDDANPVALCESVVMVRTATKDKKKTGFFGQDNEEEPAQPKKSGKKVQMSLAAIRQQEQQESLKKSLKKESQKKSLKKMTTVDLNSDDSDDSDVNRATTRSPLTQSMRSLGQSMKSLKFSVRSFVSVRSCKSMKSCCGTVKSMQSSRIGSTKSITLSVSGMSGVGMRKSKKSFKSLSSKKSKSFRSLSRRDTFSTQANTGKLEICGRLATGAAVALCFALI